MDKVISFFAGITKDEQDGKGDNLTTLAGEHKSVLPVNSEISPKSVMVDHEKPQVQVGKNEEETEKNQQMEENEEVPNVETPMKRSDDSDFNGDDDDDSSQLKNRDDDKEKENSSIHSIVSGNDIEEQEEDEPTPKAGNITPVKVDNECHVFSKTQDDGNNNGVSTNSPTPVVELEQKCELDIECHEANDQKNDSSTIADEIDDSSIKIEDTDLQNHHGTEDSTSYEEPVKNFEGDLETEAPKVDNTDIELGKGPEQKLEVCQDIDESSSSSPLKIVDDTMEDEDWQDNENLNNSYCKEALKFEKKELQSMKVASSISKVGNQEAVYRDEERATFTFSDSESKSGEVADTFADVQPKGQETNEVCADYERHERDAQDIEQQSKVIDCGALGLDIANLSFTIFMAISFLSGSCLMISDSYYLEETNLLFFWLVGALCYLGSTSIDIAKRKSKGVLFETILGLIGLLAGIFWFVGSIFLFRNMFNTYLFGGFFGVGSALNLYVITQDLITLFKSHQSKSVFRILSLCMAWIANLLYVGGVWNLAIVVNHWYCCSGAEGATGTLIAGSVIYFISGIFQILALSMNDYVISIKVGRSSTYSQVPVSP